MLIKNLKLGFALLWLCLSTTGWSQYCGTMSPDSAYLQSLPWYGSRSFLEEYIASEKTDSLNSKTQQPQGSGGVTPAAVRIPIQFILANDDNGNQPMEIWELEDLVRQTNEFHSNSETGIQFYRRCDIIEFNADSLHTGIVTSTVSNLYNLVDSDDAIDVFVINSTNSNWAGIANFPSSSFPYHTIISGDQTNRDLVDISITLCHELGHCLNLFHTHHPKQLGVNFNHECQRCRQESVDHSRGNGLLCSNTGTLKCTINGDILCDTEADPGLNPFQNFDITTCTYNGTGNTGTIPDDDNWGDNWVPDVGNIMSYAGRCRNGFSPMQGAVQRITATNGIANVGQFLTNDFDVYEPNNFRETARWINQGDVQCHTFHFSGGTLEEPEACDEDWLTFSTNSFGSVLIKTWDVLYQPQPNTELNLFDNNLNLIANNDNFGSGFFAWIQNVNLAAGDYFIQVINNSIVPSAESRGHYNISLQFGPPVSNESPFEPSRSVSLFPNPSSGYLNIAILGKIQREVIIQIFQISGKFVGEWRRQGGGGKDIKLDLEHLTKGMYFVELEYNRVKIVKKLVIL